MQPVAVVKRILPPGLTLHLVIAFLAACGGGGSSSGGGNAANPSANALGVGSSHPHVTVQLEQRAYTVIGTGLSSLRDELSRKGPGDYFGRVTSSIAYNYSTRGNCELDSFSIEVKSAMLLPNWDPPANASDNTRRRWQVFMSALTNHELNHVRIDVSEAEALAIRLANLPQFESCSALDQAVKAEHHQVLSRANSRNRAYDDRTDHGKTEGALL